MGEFWGFLMGWNMVLEHGVGSASVAKAWSGYVDAVMGYPVKVCAFAKKINFISILHNTVNIYHIKHFLL